MTHGAALDSSSGSSVPWKRPSLSTTQALCCGTMRTPSTTKAIATPMSRIQNQYADSAGTSEAATAAATAAAVASPRDPGPTPVTTKRVLMPLLALHRAIARPRINPKLSEPVSCEASDCSVCTPRSAAAARASGSGGAGARGSSV